jgi:hypothetical protein
MQMREQRRPRGADLRDRLAGAHLVAHRNLHAAGLEMAEVTELAVTVIDHEVVAEDHHAVLLHLCETHFAGALFAVTVMQERNGSIARRKDRPPVGKMILVLFAVAAITVAVRVDYREVVRVAGRVRLEADVDSDGMIQVETAVMRIEVVTVPTPAAARRAAGAASCASRKASVRRAPSARHRRPCRRRSGTCNRAMRAATAPPAYGTD